MMKLIMMIDYYNNNNDDDDDDNGSYYDDDDDDDNDDSNKFCLIQVSIFIHINSTMHLLNLLKVCQLRG